MLCSRIDVLELTEVGDRARRDPLEVGETWPSDDSFRDLDWKQRRRHPSARVQRAAAGRGANRKQTASLGCAP